eukprot:1221873-Rhodomonas_salina.1
MTHHTLPVLGGCGDRCPRRCADLPGEMVRERRGRAEEEEEGARASGLEEAGSRGRPEAEEGAAWEE